MSLQTAYSETQRRVEDACTEAERLASLAEQEDARLRAARREKAALEREMDELGLADPRALAQAKVEAHADYRAGVKKASHPGEVTASASAWLSRIDWLNRTASSAAGRSRSLASRLREAEAKVERLSLAARVAAVSAESARQSCLDARRALASQDEAITGHASPRPLREDPSRSWLGGISPIEALLGPDRAAFASLVARLAEEAGLESSRLQLLLLELREGIVARAFEAAAFDFPEGHPFWSQFPRHEARAVAASLALLGRGFDGQSGWRDGRAADPREMAVALSMAGRDPRTVRYRPMRAELDSLWEGTSIAAVSHLTEQAPDLGLEQVVTLLGDRAEALADLWDNWGRMRRLLLSRPPAA
jgi:hypothetical protein